MPSVLHEMANTDRLPTNHSGPQCATGVVELSLNVTVPVGLTVMPPGGVRTAVKIASWFCMTTGLDSYRVTVGTGIVMVSATAVEVLVVPAALPLYTALIEWLPMARAVVVNAAVPPLRATTPRRAVL